VIRDEFALVGGEFGKECARFGFSGKSGIGVGSRSLLEWRGIESGRCCELGCDKRCRFGHTFRIQPYVWVFGAVAACFFFGVSFFFVSSAEGEWIKFFSHIENGHTIFLRSIKRRFETFFKPEPVRHDQRGIAQLRGLCCRRFKIMGVSAQGNEDVNVDLIASDLTDKVAEDWRGCNHERSAGGFCDR
jgi:hypothetical protein